MKFALSLSILPFALVSSLHAGIGTELLYKGLERPVWAGAPASAKGKLWVMEQAGAVWIIDLETGEKSDKPFLEIKGKVTRSGNEQGLLGLAFAPDFESSGRYYVNYNEKGGDTCIVRYVSKDRRTTDPESGEVILKIDQPYGNHNGGWLDFGPDGMLYIAMGDGGVTGGDSIDDATKLVERENASLLADRSNSLVRELTDALRRLRQEPDAFNRCVRCQGAIPFGRLDLLPTTRTCMRASSS